MIIAEAREAAKPSGSPTAKAMALCESCQNRSSPPFPVRPLAGAFEFPLSCDLRIAEHGDEHSERPVYAPIDRQSTRVRWPRTPSGNAKRESVAFQNWCRSVWNGIETCASGQGARTGSRPSEDPSDASFSEASSRNFGERLSSSSIDVGPALPAGWQAVGSHHQSPRDFETPSAKPKPKSVLENLAMPQRLRRRPVVPHAYNQSRRHRVSKPPPGLQGGGRHFDPDHVHQRYSQARIMTAGALANANAFEFLGVTGMHWAQHVRALAVPRDELPGPSAY